MAPSNLPARVPTESPASSRPGPTAPPSQSPSRKCSAPDSALADGHDEPGGGNFHSDRRRHLPLAWRLRDDHARAHATLAGSWRRRNGAVRTDQPGVAEDLTDLKSLPDRSGDRDELRQRLQRLPPGHPSSPLETDGTPRSPEPGLACRESSDAAELREADR